MKYCLALARPAREVPRHAVVFDLRDVARNRSPTLYLSRIVVVSSPHIIPSVPLKPATRVVLVDPPFLLPYTEWLTCVYLKKITLFMSLTIWRELCISEPFFWKLISTISHIESTKYAECKHFFRCKLWLEVGMKILSHWFCQSIYVPCLHPVIYGNCFHIRKHYPMVLSRCVSTCARVPPTFLFGFIIPCGS